MLEHRQHGCGFEQNIGENWWRMKFFYEKKIKYAIHRESVVDIWLININKLNCELLTYQNSLLNMYSYSLLVIPVKSVHEKQ